MIQCFKLAIYFKVIVNVLNGTCKLKIENNVQKADLTNSSKLGGLTNIYTQFSFHSVFLTFMTPCVKRIKDRLELT